MTEPLFPAAPPRSVDGFDEAAAAKIWALLPGVHRAQDAAVLDGTGPLQALLNRAATQMGLARRSIERLWEDQSVETCDDWVLPYLAELLDTDLVPSMDPRGMRLDVANTIYYRRRKGTVALLEQLAADVTGWECRVVEFFRTLARTRHLLDPAIGRPADDPDPPGARMLQRAAGLVGPLTGTPAGGSADLRRAVGRADADGPFDEFHHRADVRTGRGALGWYGIPKVGVFLWQSAGIAVDRATPVGVAGCADHYAFDPTGRQTALWQADDRPVEGFGERWTSLAQWQVPGPMTEGLYDAVRQAGLTPPVQDAYPDPKAALWPASVAVRPLEAADPLDPAAVKVWPEVGRFAVPAGTGDIEASYHYGLFSRIGAGPYDRRRLGVAQTSDPLPAASVAGGSPVLLKNALAALGATGTLVVTDGLTSTALADVGAAEPGTPIADVAIRAADEGRAVVRLPAGAHGVAPWVFTGSAPGPDPAARLRLEGLLLSGVDIVLRGGFASVTLSCCTLDPGTAGNLASPPTLWQPAVDGRELRAGTLWIEGTVRNLVIDRCVTGPIRSRAGGVVQTLCASDSVVQGLPGDTGGKLGTEGVFDPEGLVRVLRDKPDALTAWLADKLGATAADAVAGHRDGDPVSDAALTALVTDLDGVVAAPMWDAARFADRGIPAGLAAAAAAGPVEDALVRVNRGLLAVSFPKALGQAAIALDEGLARLVRCTVLGAVLTHRLECSESILDDTATVLDTQDGCVRFSAWASGSSVPRKYESVEIPVGAPLFESRRFGEAGYAQLARDADTEIVGSSTAGAPSIRTGSRAGSEMGAFCRDGAAVKERSLLVKYQEFLPVGLTPVLIPMPPPDAEAETLRGRPWPPM